VPRGDVNTATSGGCVVSVGPTVTAEQHTPPTDPLRRIALVVSNRAPSPSRGLRETHADARQHGRAFHRVVRRRSHYSKRGAGDVQRERGVAQTREQRVWVGGVFGPAATPMSRFFRFRAGSTGDASLIQGERRSPRGATRRERQ
jgi:hypothetical protein